MCTLIATMFGVFTHGDKTIKDGLNSKEARPFIEMLGFAWILEVLVMFVKLVFRSFRKSRF